MPTQRGSIVLFVLFVCLGVAVLVQTLSTIAICANGAVVTEDTGRRRMGEKDDALAVLRARAARSWAPIPWTPVGEGPPVVEGTLTDVTDGQGLVLEATVRHQPDISPVVISAAMERGRDGLDLPLTGVVAEGVTIAAGRASPWLEIEALEAAVAAEFGAATAYLGTDPSVSPVGPGVTVSPLGRPWRLDEGWRTLAGLGAEAGAAGIALCGPQGCFLGAEDVLTTTLPAGWGASSAAPGLVVVTGGTTLDGSGRGELYGVIVVDDGDVRLEGTRLHGAVIASGTLHLGSGGAVVFAPSILRWATDRSLQRTRLMPGTRWERTA